MTGPMLVSVVLDDALLTLSRAVSLVRRRNLPIRHLAVSLDGPGSGCRMSFQLHGDAAAARGVAELLRNIIGVQEVTLSAATPDGQEQS